MGVLEKYKYVNNYGIEVEPPKGYTPPVTKKERKYVAPKAIPVTVAHTNPRSADFITAHTLQDYRRASFNLVLLPHVDLAYDIIAKEVYGLSECL